MAKKHRIPHKFLPWIEARKRFKLSHTHIQMARELGLSPKKFGSYANREKQPWKLPLVDFIEFLYERQFKKTAPDEVKSIEQIAAEHVAKRAVKKAAKADQGEEMSSNESAAELESGEEISPDLISENEETGPDPERHDQATETGDDGDDHASASAQQTAAGDQGTAAQAHDDAGDETK